MKADPLGRLLFALRGPESTARTGQSEQGSTAQSERKATLPPSGSDAVVLSKSLKSRNSEESERSDRLDRLKESVQDGSYSVSSEDVASAFAKELAL